VPTAESILTWATEVANDWRWLALVWHVALAALLISLVVRPQLSRRLVGVLLVLPVSSVGVLAWVSGNPFNGVVFAVLAAAFLSVAMSLPKTSVARASPIWVTGGATLVGFGWAYPHFVTTDTWTAYAYASPFGLLPCPTLSVVIGLTMVFRGLQSAAWSLLLCAAGVLYGWIGVFVLQVRLDLPLLAGATLLGALVVANLVTARVCATEDERARRLPGDEFIPRAIGTFTHAITIAGPPSAVWPWLVQMGAGSRAGWYTYDFLDNARQPSATRIVPELQHIRVGTVFPALPGMTAGFIVLAFEPGRALVLGWPHSDGSPMVSWAFVLEPRARDATRLIVRVRADSEYELFGLPVRVAKPVRRLEHFVMQRKQLVGIAQRVECSAGARREAA